MGLTPASVIVAWVVGLVHEATIARGPWGRRPVGDDPSHPAHMKAQGWLGSSRRSRRAPRASITHHLPPTTLAGGWPESDPRGGDRRRPPPGPRSDPLDPTASALRP